MNAPKVEEPPTESARLDTLQAEKQRLLTKEESQKQDLERLEAQIAAKDQAIAAAQDSVERAEHESDKRGLVDRVDRQQRRGKLLAGVAFEFD